MRSLIASGEGDSAASSPRNGDVVHFLYHFLSHGTMAWHSAWQPLLMLGVVEVAVLEREPAAALAGQLSRLKHLGS